MTHDSRDRHATTYFSRLFHYFHTMDNLTTQSPVDPSQAVTGLPLDPTEAVAAVKDAIVIPPGWFISPILPPSVPLVLTSIPFDPKIKEVYEKLESPIDQNNAQFMTDLIGEDNFKEMLDDAAHIGEANAMVDECFDERCFFIVPVAYCCLPCTYCVYKRAYNKPGKLFSKWQNVMADKDVDFELWFRPGSIMAALIFGNKEIKQQTWAFVIRPKINLQAVEEKALEALEELKELKDGNEPVVDAVTTFFNFVGAQLSFFGGDAPEEEKKASYDPINSEKETSKSNEEIRVNTPNQENGMSKSPDEFRVDTTKSENETSKSKEDIRVDTPTQENGTSKSPDEFRVDSRAASPSEEKQSNDVETNNSLNSAPKKTPERVCGCLDGSDGTSCA
jgi:hypothetical protein